MAAFVTDATRKRLRPNRDATSAIGGERDLDVVASLAWAGFLTTRQIERLHFPSRRRAQRRLRALFDHGLVRAHMQGCALERENVYTPSPLGLDRLVERGDLAPEHPAPPRLPAAQKLPHALAIRDVFVAVALEERAERNRECDVAFDSDLARDPRFYPHGLVPDAVLVLRTGERLATVAVEVDRGTETTTTLRVKLGKWRSVLELEPSLALVFVVPTDSRAATIERIATDAAVTVRLARADDLSRFVANAWPHPTAAPVGRTERPAETSLPGLFRAAR